MLGVLRDVTSKLFHFLLGFRTKLWLGSVIFVLEFSNINKDNFVFGEAKRVLEEVNADCSGFLLVLVGIIENVYHNFIANQIVFSL
jgi:hypothetical protein